MCVKSVLYLGHVLTENLQDDLHLQQCRSDFIKRANCILHRFGFVHLWFVLFVVLLLYVILYCRI